MGREGVSYDIKFLDVSISREVMLQTEQLFLSQDNKGVHGKGKCLHLSFDTVPVDLAWAEIEKYQSCDRNIEVRRW